MEKEEDIKRLKTIQLELHEDFIKIVKSRGTKLRDPDKNNIFTGEFLDWKNIAVWINRWYWKC